MSFFSNGAVNRVNLHYGIQALATGMGGIFLLVFLIRAGVPTPLVLALQGAFSAQRFILRPFVIPLVRRIGLRRTLIAGVLLEALPMLMAPLVHGPGPALLVLAIAAPPGSVLYWTCYHAYFAAIGDAEHRGGQIGLREALAALVGIAAPLLGALALATGGPWFAFVAAAGVQLLAALPLLGAPDVPVATEAPGGFRAAGLGASLMLTDGWLSACYYYVWQVALFVALKQDFSAYGGAMALSALVGAVGGLLLGRRIDAGHGRLAMAAAYAIITAVVILRAASLGSPWLAVTANAFGALVAALQAPAMMTAVYNMAKASPCPLRFHIACEGGWDIGCAAGCFAAAAISAAGGSLSLSILLGLAGAGAAGLLLWRHYGPTPASAAAG